LIRGDYTNKIKKNPLHFISIMALSVRKYRPNKDIRRNKNRNYCKIMHLFEKPCCYVLKVFILKIFVLYEVLLCSFWSIEYFFFLKSGKIKVFFPPKINTGSTTSDSLWQHKRKITRFGHFSNM